MSTSSGLRRFRTRGRKLQSKDKGEPSATERQERVPGFDQARFENLCVALIGAGGLGGEVAEGLVRKGVGCLKICDHDKVALSNLSRQKFSEHDLGKNKAIQLCKNLEAQTIRETELWGYPYHFQDIVDVGRPEDLVCDLAICAVDNNASRVFASEYARKHKIPLVILGVSRDASHGYAFLQEARPEAACFGCLFPGSVAGREPCPNTPAVIDILKVVGGLALYAVDAAVMRRPSTWTYKHIYLDGSLEDCSIKVERQPDCPLCSVIHRPEPLGSEPNS